jgi:hypothetical protein
MTGLASGQFMQPQSLDVDPYGYIYVADRGNDRIQKFSRRWLDVFVGYPELPASR